MDSLVELWRSLGPLGPCAVLFFLGCLLITGFVLNWKWLYPSKKTVRNYNPGINRPLLLITGVLLLGCSIFFYMFRDLLHWQ